MSKTKHRPRDVALPIAEYVVWWLKAKNVNSYICGSLRRGLLKVGDVDLSVETGSLFNVVAYIANGCKCGSKEKEIGCELVSNVKLESKKMDMIIGGIRFNIYKARKDQWGAMVLFLTGNFLFNILMRGRAKDLGMKLNQYGLFHGDEIIAGKTEEQIFAALGMSYVRPEDREYKSGMYLPQL